MSGSDATLDRIGTIGVVPVVELKDASAATALAETLVTAGLPLIEITLRTPTAIDAIRAAAAHGGLLVGAGTVVNAEQVDRAVEAGAAFVVSPGISAAVVERCQAHGIPCLPGVASPTDIMTALDLGLDTLKLFPADMIGGIPALRAFSGPFPQVRFIPTSGIDATTAPDFLAVPSVLAVGGSWMAPKAALAAEDWDTVQRLAEEAVAIGAARGGA